MSAVGDVSAGGGVYYCGGEGVRLCSDRVRLDEEYEEGSKRKMWSEGADSVDGAAC